MSGRLTGKVALVTGAAQGIGRAIVAAFIAEGTRVIAADINRDRLQELSQLPGIEPCVLDVTDGPMILEAAKRHGDVNVLVNCAGFVASGSILTATREDLDRCYRLNVGSVFSVSQAFLPAMIDRRDGAIVNIASVVSTVKAAKDRCAYAASKGAVIALTKSMALDLIGYGVRCNAISPGTVHTPSLDERMAAQPDPDEAMRQFVARQPLGRLGQVEEIAAVAVLMASAEAQFMTGSNVVIDGGFSL
ncbi:MAG: SDR family oxidoreductase [Gammaproteobacteria bacterium]